MSEQITGNHKHSNKDDLDSFIEPNETLAPDYPSFEESEVNIQPVPKWLKWGAIALLVLLVLATANFIFSKESNSEFDSDRIEDSPISLLSDDKTHAITKTTEGPKDYASIEAPSIEQSSETELKLIQLQEQLSQLIADNNLRQNSQDAIIKGLESQLNAQVAQIEQLQSNLKARQRVVKAKKKVMRTYRVKVPFTLVSVDQWGNDLYAVVRLQGQLYEFTYGQGIKGWHVSTFDTNRGAVTFKNKSGSRKELLIKS